MRCGEEGRRTRSNELKLVHVRPCVAQLGRRLVGPVKLNRRKRSSIVRGEKEEEEEEEDGRKGEGGG